MVRNCNLTAMLIGYDDRAVRAIALRFDSRDLVSNCDRVANKDRSDEANPVIS
jgi:hypothetical protein